MGAASGRWPLETNRRGVAPIGNSRRAREAFRPRYGRTFSKNFRREFEAKTTRRPVKS
jgi:hypothetical protein